MHINGFLQAAALSLKSGRPISFCLFRFHRLLLKGTTPFTWYPSKIKKSKPETIFPVDLTYQLPVKPRSRDKVKAEVFNRFDRIKLASCEYSFDDSVDWWPEFEDDEDLESLHRWNWLLYMLSSVDQDVFSTLVFKDKAKRLISDWFDTILNDDAEIFWDTYSVGERISNIIIFCHYTGLELPDLWRTELANEISHVIDNLEYAGGYTGNHVFNNARAVYLAGCAFNQEEWRSFAKEIALRELKHLLTADGFLREGSSHYHFLFTRWILELIYFAELIRDDEFQKSLAPFATLAVNKLWFFLIYDSGKKDWRIPLIGDISPDFSPEWLTDIPWSQVALEAYHPNKLPTVPKTCGWANIFGMKAPKLLEKWKYKSQEGIQDYEASGWFRINSADAVLLWYANPDVWRAKATHAHCDIGSFNFYLKGEPILIDSGRLNYTNDDWSRYGLSAQAHNTVCVDDEGCFPITTRNFPEIFDMNDINSHVRKKGDVYEAAISYQGYIQSGESIKAVRRLVLTDRQLIIEDELQGRKQHDIELFYHFGENVKCLKQDDAVLQLKISSAKLNVKFERSRGKKFKIDRYFGGDEMHGWCVGEYGQKMPSFTAKVSFRGQLPVTVKTIMEWS